MTLDGLTSLSVSVGYREPWLANALIARCARTLVRLEVAQDPRTLPQLVQPGPLCAWELPSLKHFEARVQESLLVRAPNLETFAGSNQVLISLAHFADKSHFPRLQSVKTGESKHPVPAIQMATWLSLRKLDLHCDPRCADALVRFLLSCLPNLEGLQLSSYAWSDSDTYAPDVAERFRAELAAQSPTAGGTAAAPNLTWLSAKDITREAVTGLRLPRLHSARVAANRALVRALLQTAPTLCLLTMHQSGPLFHVSLAVSLTIELADDA